METTARTGHDGRRLKPRPTTLTKTKQSVHRKLQRGIWRCDELQWLERRLPPDAPTVLVVEVRHRLQVLPIPPTSRA
jgi:hypothetical protein